MNAKLPVALTSGDPAGIGPEITCKAWRALRDEGPFFWIGDVRHLPPDCPVKTISNPGEATDIFADALPVLNRPFPSERDPGQPDPANAGMTADVIREAVELVTAGQASALCTNPINKAALKSGTEFPFPGHTEFLAHLAGCERSVMMLASDTLKVVPVTIHIPLADVASSLTPDLVETTIRVTERALRRQFDLRRPRLAVAGLNPHAGEGGLMGTEDDEVIAPVLDKLRSEGMTISGPLPADTMFHDRARKTYDAAICMYHDQALIPIKTIAFDTGVNVTLGLPFVRTSPDHGTAYDIAGQNIANPASLIAALRLAARLGSGQGA